MCSAWAPAFAGEQEEALRHVCRDKYGFVLASLVLALEDAAIGEQVREAARGLVARG